MMGDSVDNIPGLPGVGDKTAKKFLKQFGNMENLFKNLDQVQGKLKEKIESNKDLGILSKKLATIITDVPVQFNQKDYELSDPDMNAASTIFEELEFRRIHENFKRIFTLSDEPNATKIDAYPTANPGSPAQFDLFDSSPGQGTALTESSKNNQQSVNQQYQWVNTPTGRSLLLEKLLKKKVFVLIPKPQDWTPCKPNWYCFLLNKKVTASLLKTEKKLKQLSILLNP